MKKLVVSVFAGAIALVAAPSAKADLIDAWDFLNLPATTTTTATPSTIAATVGTGSIDISAFGLGSPQGTSPERTAFTGTAVDNAFLGSDVTTATPTQMALSFANSTANGKSMIISFSTLGFSGLELSFATRGTATGFNSQSWAWSTDGVNYTSVGANTANNTSTWLVKTVSFGSSLDNVATAYIKLTFAGAMAASGNNRLDNIQFNAAPVPEPSTLALATLGGVACLFALRRKR